MKRLFILLWTLLFTFSFSVAQARSITDALGRQIAIPERVTHVLCSGSGCLRLLSYLEGQEFAVAADEMETRYEKFTARPYALAYPEFKKLPQCGEIRGHDNPEHILMLSPAPQVIFKTVSSHQGTEPDKLQKKTGIPVIAIHYGNLDSRREELFQSLRIIGEVIDKQQRAEDVVSFIQTRIADLKKRTAHIPDSKRPRTFVGGVAYRGPHGYQSTEPGYPPFAFVGAKNLAAEGCAGKALSKHASVAKEKILAWDPDVLFLDLSTLQMEATASGLYELKNDPAYQSLTAVQKNRVYGVLPYNWYSKNYGSILANAYYAGKILYPEEFADINPAHQADEIFRFLVGAPVFERMNSAFSNLAFSRITVSNNGK